MSNLLLEIGTEEIPAGYITPALNALSSVLLQKLTEARIEHGQARVYATPRRLAVVVENDLLVEIAEIGHQPNTSIVRRSAATRRSISSRVL